MKIPGASTFKKLRGPFAWLTDGPHVNNSHFRPIIWRLYYFTKHGRACTRIMALQRRLGIGRFA